MGSSDFCCRGERHGSMGSGGMGIVGAFVFVCMVMRTAEVNAQRKRETELMLEQQSHEVRLAMIERGMTPPSAPPSETPQMALARETNRNAPYRILGTIGGLAPFCALLSGSTAAWLCAGLVGLASVIALVIIYLKNASLGKR